MLGVSLLILVVMTALGVSAMLGSNLQERMVANQKQVIEASMAAESGAVMAIRWLRAHPEAWGDAEAWQADDGLPFAPPSAPNIGGGVVYWIESVRFDGDTATVVSRGGLWVADRIREQSAVTVAWQIESDGADSALEAREPAGTGQRQGGNDGWPAGSVDAAIHPLVEIAELQAQPASVGVKSEHDPATAGDAVGHASSVARPADPPEAKRMRGKVIHWRRMTAVGE